MPIIYDIDELEKAAAEKHSRVRDAIRSPIVPLTLQQLETDMQGRAPSFGQLFKRRLTANAKRHLNIYKAKSLKALKVKKLTVK